MAREGASDDAMDTNAEQSVRIEVVIAAHGAGGSGGECETPLGVLEGSVGVYADGDAGGGCGDKIDDFGGGVGGYEAIDEMENGGGIY